MTSFHSELEKQLKEARNRFLNPPSPIDDLLTLLDEVENLLANVEQVPSKSIRDALFPLVKALINNKLLRHAEMDVKVLVVSSIIEIARITAPDAPYKDERMKEIFQLIVAACENMSHVSTRSYKKVTSILDTIAKVKLCLVMLDLECDALVVEMFQSFLKMIRFNHPPAVLSAMETIMSLVINESEDISLDLLSSLFVIVRKVNQNFSPISWTLGEQIITRINAQLE
ncbi:sister chromatid cohesion protein pds5-like [Quercus lobata]|uniref:sister chromatid cohesion protein pds5-like n=1 Tax=Quercus lobata TaxID=97700 RepID=UPI001245E12E|nr:sister chromatid cohesion protein pds5-like [Quercus lobata]